MKFSSTRPFKFKHFVLGIFLGTACATSIAADATRSVDLPLSSSLTLKGHYKVTIQQAAALQKAQVIIKGEESSVNGLVVEGNQQGIQISYPNGLEPRSPLTLEIHTNGLENVLSEGNSSLQITGVTGSQFMLTLQGNSDIQVSNIKTAQFNLKTKGNTQANLSGESTQLGLDLFGNTKLDAVNLAATKATLTSKGSSDIQINVKETLERNLEGRTSLSVKGHPTVSGQANGVVELKEIQ